MSGFLGTHVNRIDAKGRVSVPSAFRAGLHAQADKEAPWLVLRRSHRHPCIEGWPGAEFARLAAPLDRFDLFGEDHDDLAATIYGDALPVESDKEGRIVLPEDLVRFAGLSDTVTFMGLGRHFQIWEPEAGRARQEAARARARERALTLSPTRPDGGRP